MIQRVFSSVIGLFGRFLFVLLSLVVSMPAIASDLGLFKMEAPGQLPSGWAAQFHPEIPNHTDLSIESINGEPVLAARAKSAYGSWAYKFPEPTAVKSLSWQWSVRQKPEKADLRTKAGDDSALKVCVFVDIDESRLGLGTRLALGTARTLSGQFLPAATLCYQWANKGEIGTIFPNPYTNRVINKILRTEPASDQWFTEFPDIQADIKAAFGDELPRAQGVASIRLLGLAIGADTDNTGSFSEAYLKQLEFNIQ